MPKKLAAIVAAIPLLAFGTLWYFGVVFPGEGPLGDLSGNQIGGTGSDGSKAIYSAVIAANAPQNNVTFNNTLTVVAPASRSRRKPVTLIRASLRA